MPKSGFKLVSGEPTTFEVKGNNKSLRNFCGTCGSTMWNEATKLPDCVVIKAGVIDDGELAKLTPSSESFTCRRPGWVKGVEGARQFEESFPV